MAAGGRQRPDDLRLSRAEVAQLWWFSDGAIMNPDIRQRLCRGWGLCARHTWSYFLIECELRWQPLGITVLYQDLLDRVIDAWPRRWLPAGARRRVFTGQPFCPTCDYLTHAHEASGFAAEQERANRLTRSRAFVVECQADWRQLMCPWCVPSGPGVPCREHLASGEAPLDRTVHEALAGLRRPLERCMRSMTHGGPSPAPESNAALVTTLGWFAGWRPALMLAPDAWSDPLTSARGELR